MIRFRNVSKHYPRSGAALDEVSFHVRKAEFAFLTGHSGAGKTTVLRLIHFQTRPTEGEVQVSRYSSARIKRRQIPDLRRRVGFVFQDFKLLDRLTASENVAFALEVTGTRRREIPPKVQRLLSQVGLAAKARSRPAELSGGERQRVVIARALATDPLILLADEPTGNLDPRAADGVFRLFWTINQLGMAVVMATHDTELIRRHPEVRVLELEHGRLVFDSGSPDGRGPMTGDAAGERADPALAGERVDAARAGAPAEAAPPAAADASGGERSPAAERGGKPPEGEGAVTETEGIA